jgi:hypothetical protein
MLARWQICYNPTFCEKADKTVTGQIGKFRESTRKTRQDPAFSVGVFNPVFWPILIQYT